MGKRDVKTILEKHPQYANQIKRSPQWIKGKDSATLIVACQKLVSSISDTVILFAKRSKYSSIGVILRCDQNAQVPFTEFSYADLQQLQLACVAFVEANRALMQIHVYFKSSAEKTWNLQFASQQALEEWVIEMRKYLGLVKGESSIKGVCEDLQTYLFREIDPFSSDVQLTVEKVQEEKKCEAFVLKLEREVSEEKKLELDSENSDISEDEDLEKFGMQEMNLRLKEELDELKLRNKELLRELQIKENEESVFRGRMERYEDRSFLIPTKEKTNQMEEKNSELMQQNGELKKINLLLITENDALKKQIRELKDAKKEDVGSKGDQNLSKEMARRQKMYNDQLEEKGKMLQKYKAIIDVMTNERKTNSSTQSELINEKNGLIKGLEQKLALAGKQKQEIEGKLIEKQKECNEMRAIMQEKQRKKEKKSKERLIEKEKQENSKKEKEREKQQARQLEIKAAKVETPPVPQKQDLFQPIRLQLERKNKEALRLIAEREQKIADLQIDRLLHIFEKDALSGEREAKIYLCEQIGLLCKRKVRFTKLLCNLDPLNKTNFHKYIDEVPSLCMVVRTVANQLIAGFSIHPVSPKNQAIQGGILVNMTRRKTYFCKEGRRAVTHDDVYMIFGNSELRVLSGGDDLLSNLGISKGYFDHRGDKVTELIGDCPQRTVKLVCYEFYQVVFY